jgi:hypothetical protein
LFASFVSVGFENEKAITPVALLGTIFSLFVYGLGSLFIFNDPDLVVVEWILMLLPQIAVCRRFNS